MDSETNTATVEEDLEASQDEIRRPKETRMHARTSDQMEQHAKELVAYCAKPHPVHNS